MKNKSKYFRCSVSDVENGFDVGRVCFIGFTSAISLDEAREFVFIENIKYDDLHIVVDRALDKEIDTFIKIKVDKEKLKRRSLNNFTIEKLKKEIKIQEAKIEKYIKEKEYGELSDCQYQIQNFKDEIKKRVIKLT